MLRWLRSLMGRSRQPDGRSLAKSIQPLTTDEMRLLTGIRQREISELRSRYSLSDEDDTLTMLQCTIRDGTFFQTTDMRPLGIAWGDLICQAVGAEWVTADWNGSRLFAANLPHTTILVFPIAMLEKRRDRNEKVDFQLFLTNAVDAIKTMQRNPEYRR